jgi:transposase
MDVMVECCAGLDIGKDEVVGCVRAPGPGGRGRRSELRVFSTFTSGLEALADWMTANGVGEVVMEATGQYWKPVWYVLEERGFDLKLVNARHVKMVPGRKTDLADAAWLAELLEHGLLRSSFVPPPAIRELRDLTRYRKRLIQTHTAEQQRVQKILEDAGIKLDSVASDVLGVSGRAMLHALIAGERDPEVLAELSKGVLRKKIPQLREALRGRFWDHHALMIRIALDHVEHLEAAIAALDIEVEKVMAPFAEARDHLDTIVGVGKRAAECIIAEIGVDMTRFPTAAHLASWAKFAPGIKESAGRKKGNGATGHGNRYLARVLGEAAVSAAKTDTFLGERYRRIARRRGKKRAIVAVGRSILVITWHLLADQNATYHDLGPDWYDSRVNLNRKMRNHVRELQNLGYRVTLEPAA